MILWIDAQLSPALADWVRQDCGVECHALRDLGLRDAKDREIYEAARAVEAVVMTKDRDFPLLLDQFGPPPQVLWVTCGNTSNAVMRHTLKSALPAAMILLQRGEPLVEISAARPE